MLQTGNDTQTQHSQYELYGNIIHNSMAAATTGGVAESLQEGGGDGVLHGILLHHPYTKCNNSE